MRWEPRLGEEVKIIVRAFTAVEVGAIGRVFEIVYGKPGAEWMTTYGVRFPNGMGWHFRLHELAPNA